MSAPVKGRLDVDEPLPPDADEDEALEAGGVGSYDDDDDCIVGVLTQPGWLVEPADPHAGSAPAAWGTSTIDASANPEPAMSRLAHMVYALLPVEAVPQGPRPPVCRFRPACGSWIHHAG
jgi:hypothetical protein